MSRSSPHRIRSAFSQVCEVFEYIGGVPQVIRFDNMSTAVVKVLE